MRVFDRVVLESMNLPLRMSVGSNIDASKINFLKNNVFQRYINLDLRGKEVEVPIFCRSEVQPLLLSSQYSRLYEEAKNVTEAYICPLFVSKEEQKRTSESIIRTMFETSTYHRLCKVTTNSGFVYYGGAGIIFNSNMEVLFLSAVKYEIPEGSENIKLINSIAYISPKVFTSNGPVEKTIIKKVIPLLIEGNPIIYSNDRRVINEYHYPNGRSSMVYRTPEIIIADVTDRFIGKPNVPDMSKFEDDEVNSFLLDNFEILIDDMTL